MKFLALLLLLSPAAFAKYGHSYRCQGSQVSLYVSVAAKEADVNEQRGGILRTYKLERDDSYNQRNGMIAYEKPALIGSPARMLTIEASALTGKVGRFGARARLVGIKGAYGFDNLDCYIAK